MGRYLDLLRQREMESQNIIRKGRVYINPGKKPPAGKQIKQGTQGGYYYETEGNKVEIYHPEYKRKLTYTNHKNPDDIERSLVHVHEGKDKLGGHARSLYDSSDEGTSESKNEQEMNKKQSERDKQSFESAKTSGEFDHEKALPKALARVKSKDGGYLWRWHLRNDPSGNQLYSSEDDAKESLKQVIKEIKPHSKDAESFKSFVDNKINDKNTSNQSRDIYRFIKSYYKDATKHGDNSTWD